MGTIPRWILASIVVCAAATAGCADTEPAAESTVVRGWASVPGKRHAFQALLFFNFRADVTVRLSEQRLLHDDLGPRDEGVVRFSYP